MNQNTMEPLLTQLNILIANILWVTLSHKFQLLAEELWNSLKWQEKKGG